ncbi:hypothetical protein DTO027B5_883 [Paecilomyces variotii]|nr:hypothetical protein DTO169C6_329 [Paecilomyces variotii]KAJ9329711.1 hypothetical protein DTO027B3_198 [Paecilomyces variotii]KAJ9337534.1 hypothetical protein DTO027B5_883 [Paecilomyces variotii]
MSMLNFAVGMEAMPVVTPSWRVIGAAHERADRSPILQLKCNGNKNGCERCQSMSPPSICTYTRTSRTTSGRKRLCLQSIPLTPEEGSLPEEKRSGNPQKSTGNEIDEIAAHSSAFPTTAGVENTLHPQSSSLFSGFSWETVLEDFLGSDESDQISASPLQHELVAERGLPYMAQHHAIDLASTANVAWPCDAGITIHGSQDQDQTIAEDDRICRSTDLVHSQAIMDAGSKTHCTCLNTMVRLLEDVDVNTNDDRERFEFDTNLMCMAQGTKTCSRLLTCAHCNACVDHAMLVASVAQQLGALAKRLTARLIQAYHSEGTLDQQRHCHLLRISTPLSCDSKERQQEDAMMPEDIEISLGRYKIESPQVVSRLVSELLLLHLTEFQTLLATMKERIAPERGAWRLVDQAENMIAKRCRIIEQLKA